MLGRPGPRRGAPRSIRLTTDQRHPSNRLGLAALATSSLVHAGAIVTAIAVGSTSASSSHWRVTVGFIAPPAVHAQQMAIEATGPAVVVLEVHEDKEPFEPLTEQLPLLEPAALLEPPPRLEPAPLAPVELAPTERELLTHMKWLARVAPAAATKSQTDAAPKDGPPATPPASSEAVEPSVVPGTNAAPRYPWVAWRRGIEGTVEIELQIDAAGDVAHARVRSSSGCRMLDDAALEALRRWRFTPARGVFGAVASTFRQQVVFRIHGGVATAPSQS